MKVTTVIKRKFPFRQLVTVALGQTIKLPKAEVFYFLPAILVITLAGQTEVVVGDKLAVGVLVVFSGLGDVHGCKSMTIIPQHQATGCTYSHVFKTERRILILFRQISPLKRVKTWEYDVFDNKN